MFEAIGDPFSSYLTSEEYKSSISGINGSFEGIGAVMATRDEAGEESCERAGPTCHVVVVRTLRDAPATRAGLRADDRILAVDDVPVDGLTIGETIDRVRGPRGTTVRLSVSRGAAEPFELAIVRETIQTEVVSSQLLADGTVGYVRLDGFSSSSADDFRDQLRTLVEGGVKGIIVDLRGDPGGFVDAAEQDRQRVHRLGAHLLGGVRRRQRDRRTRRSPAASPRTRPSRSSSSSMAARRAPARSSPGRCRTAVAAGSSASRPSARGPSSSGRP